MGYVLQEIAKGIGFTGLVYLTSYLIELLTPFGLLIWSFRLKKNLDMAQGAANVNAVLFFITCLITLLVDKGSLPNPPEGYTFWKWLLIIIPLTVLFRILYYRFTPKDPGRGDHDFSE